MDDKLFHLKSKSITAKNPIASGDFFFGTLIANLKNNQSDKIALIDSITASTANCLNWYPEFSKDQFNKIKNSHITIKSY